MLSPMQLQYLVGLCCMQRDPDAVDVTIGDMVLDAAAGKERDVDVTVTVREPDGTTRAFKAYEVKQEGSPLDIATVEQLCQKFSDMPSITKRAIVSSSGFTAPSERKAAAHGVELYKLSPWSKPINEVFPRLAFRHTPEVAIRFGQRLLCWAPGWHLWLSTEGPSETLDLQSDTNLYQADGNAHPVFPELAAYEQALLLRSTEALYVMEPARTMRMSIEPMIVVDGEPISLSPEWAHGHTLETGRDEVFLRIGDRLKGVTQVTVVGNLRWESKALPREYFVLERVPDGEVFSGVAVANWIHMDELVGIIFTPDSPTSHIHRIKLTEAQRNAIRKLQLVGRP